MFQGDRQPWCVVMLNVLNKELFDTEYGRKD